MDETQKLESLRREIRDVTKEIIRLIGRRFALVKEVERIKSSLNLKIEDPRIERELKKEVLEACTESGVERSFGLRLVKLLIEEAIRIQKRQRYRTRRAHPGTPKGSEA